MCRITCTLKTRVGQRQILLYVPVCVVQIRQIKSMTAVHGIPTNRLFKCLCCTRIVALVHTDHRQVRVQTVQWLIHLAKLAGVILYTAIRQTLKQGRKTKILHLIGGFAVAIYILLCILCKPRQQGICLLILALNEKTFCSKELVYHACLAHKSSFRDTCFVYCPSYREWHCTLYYPSWS